ncbi:(Fe-S)-binding protein [Desulfitobacterium metallireducens]|uniref:4Fe-4S ferredoxin-type domain-containing protein n=1 Tax=Desulfitobacterium metallireducens DSM 15288 TaxID=871968 RepID=W0E8F5_9FIRM|nr:(Fe-S)-binding protein [Desulfitobacterium metallireducens]AHF05788.1 hypothetical protein DESME_00775 [Desulfitobacterium metallireducens DSM 15288]
MSSEKLSKVCHEIKENCIECGQCLSECQMLQEIGEEPASIAARKPYVEEAYECSLCGLCEAVCPSSLSPKTMFAEMRTEAVKSKEIPINEYRYMFPDRKLNVMKLYREVNSIDYKDLNLGRENPVALFPGCTMLTYSPKLTRAVYTHLSQKYQDIVLMTECCGLPLYQLGLNDRGDKYVGEIKVKIRDLKIRTIIIACPNCYYQLRPILREMGITLLTIYEALDDLLILNNSNILHQQSFVTIHDSCPDRFEGIFASQARLALQKKGYQLVEMEHNHEMTICCGSGGEVSHFDPEMANNRVKSRLDEAENSGAQILAANCLACVLNFGKVSGKFQAKHILNLLLDLEQDFEGFKNKAKKMFEGPEGEKLWERIMAEP